MIEQKNEIPAALAVPPEFTKMMNSGDFTLSYSSFSNFRKSPNLFMQYKTARRETTDAMIGGQVFHCLVLEPQNFDKNFIVQKVKTPGGNMAEMGRMIASGVPPQVAFYDLYKTEKKSEKAIQKAFSDACKGCKDYVKFLRTIGKRTVISESMYNEKMLMAAAVRANPIARKFLDAEGECEKGVTWELGGFKWRGFIDKKVTQPGLKCIFDLKQVRDASAAKVARQIKYDGFAEQAALYSYAEREDGYWGADYYLIACDPNYQVSVTRITQTARQDSLNSFGYFIRKFKECIMFEDWHKSFEYFAPEGSGGVFTV